MSAALVDACQWSKQASTCDAPYTLWPEPVLADGMQCGLST